MSKRWFKWILKMSLLIYFYDNFEFDLSLKHLLLLLCNFRYFVIISCLIIVLSFLQATRVGLETLAGRPRDRIDDRIEIGGVWSRHLSLVVVAGAVGASPRLEFHEEIFVCVAILRAADGINYRIDYRTTPRWHRGHDVRPRIFHLLLEHIHDHQREKAHDEAQKDRQHHDGQAEIIFVPEELQLAFTRWRRIELIELCMLLANSVEDARIRDDDDGAWQQESNKEDKRLWWFAEFL